MTIFGYHLIKKEEHNLMKGTLEILGKRCEQINSHIEEIKSDIVNIKQDLNL